MFYVRRFHFIIMQRSFDVKDRVSAYNEIHREFERAKVLNIDDEHKKAYVHFHLHDKREDSWIDFSRIRSIQNIAYEKGIEPPSYDISQEIIEYSEDDNVDPIIERFERDQKEKSELRGVNKINYGPYVIPTWYYSPYPHPYISCDELYVCDHCASYFMTKEELDNHLQTTNELCPPGKEIYRCDNISIFEIIGYNDKFTCQCLTILCKLFLEQKTIYYDVEGFKFYVLCECDDKGAHIAAYFSQEWESDHGNILSCIVTLPPYQKKGYGSLLISLSYELARRMKKNGIPEHPLSSLGRKTYLSYWINMITIVLVENRYEIHDVRDIVVRTGIAERDIVQALEYLHYVDKVDDTNIVIPEWDRLEYEYKLLKLRGFRYINRSLLIWDPNSY